MRCGEIRSEGPCEGLSSVLIFPGKKPKKPPRPSLPKSVARKPSPEIGATTDEKLETKEPSGVQLDKDQRHRSVTVHWNIIKQPLCAVAPETTSSRPEQSQVPVPLPRSKQRKQPTAEEDEAHVLVQPGENRDTVSSDPGETASHKYLNELVGVFNLSKERVENSDSADRVPGGEDAFGEMSNSHRNIQARIQAFESQGGPAEATEPAKPEPEPRKVTTKPPVAAKPSVALKPQFDRGGDTDSQNVSRIDNPPAPAPKPPKKPVGLSIKAELETLHKGTALNRSHLPKLARSSCVYDEDPSPVPPVKAAKEPLKPNLNINNHNCTSVLQENQYVHSPSSE